MTLTGSGTAFSKLVAGLRYNGLRATADRLRERLFTSGAPVAPDRRVVSVSMSYDEFVADFAREYGLDVAADGPDGPGRPARAGRGGPR